MINSKSGVEHEIEIVVPAEELQPYFDKAFKEKGKTLQVPGFRRGRVPPAIVKKWFGEAIEYDVLEKLTQNLFQQSMEERNIHPIGSPKVEVFDYRPQERFTFRIRYETAPEVVLNQYKGIEVERFIHEVTDDEVEEELHAIRKSRRRLEPAEKADEEGYQVVCDITFLDEEGKPLPDRTYTGLTVDLGDESLNRDLRAELLNMRAGEEREAELSFDTDDGTEMRKARIVVHRIEKIILPDLDDAFASEVSEGKIDTLEALRDDIRRQLERMWNARYDAMLRNELVSQLVRRNPVDVPPMIVERILDRFVEEYKARFPGKNPPATFDETAYRASREAEARNIAAWYFLRDAIMEAEHLVLDDVDLERAAVEQAPRYAMTKEQMLEHFRKEPERTQDILHEKLMSFLIAHAAIREVSDEDTRGTAFGPRGEPPPGDAKE
ncbi:MAG: trigger factor [Bacteroidota bacterium]|nr:trigger factor [Bacteroidota bacterium]